MQESFLWFDLETFGRDPKRSRIAQFAAIRTDSDLRVIGDPVVRYCQPRARSVAFARSPP